jgi:hypothetical protein
MSWGTFTSASGGALVAADGLRCLRQVFSTPIVFLVQFILPCILASKCVAGLLMNEEWQQSKFWHLKIWNFVGYYLLPHFGIVSSFINSIFQ